MRFKLSDKAEQDLENIYLYSYENWGISKAIEYIEEIEKTISNLLDHPKLGKLQIKNKRTYYTFPCQSHIIYYHLQADILYVLSILHKSSIPVLPKHKKVL